MSTPIVEQMAVKIAALIDAITVANGFNQDLTAVRPKRIHFEGDLTADNTVFVQQGIGTPAIETSDVTHWIQEFILSVIIIDSDDATDPIDIRCNTIGADIIKKLMESNNWKLDGLADGIVLTQIDRYIGIIGDHPESILEITFDVHFQPLTDDPYSLT